MRDFLAVDVEQLGQHDLAARQAQPGQTEVRPGALARFGGRHGQQDRIGALGQQFAGLARADVEAYARLTFVEADSGFSTRYDPDLMKTLEGLDLTLTTNGSTLVKHATALKDAGLNKGDYNVSPVGGTDQRLDAMTKDKNNAAAGIMGLPLHETACLLNDAGWRL